MSKSKIEEVKILAETKFLNFYEAKYKNKMNVDRTWTIASRKKHSNYISQIVNKVNEKVDAVVMVAYHVDEEKIVLVKQFRVPINDYIYELPAGLVDNNEEFDLTLKRELFEETGLNLLRIVEGIGANGVYLSPGMTDESVSLVYCLCDGKLSSENLEDDEEIEPMLVSVKEAKSLLNSGEKFDIKCLMALQSFVNLGGKLFNTKEE